MRTTLTIDDDVLERAKSRAHIRKVSVGEALSELARMGIETEVEIRISPITGLPVIHHRGGGTITSEDVYRLQAAEDLDKALEFMGKR